MEEKRVRNGYLLKRYIEKHPQCEFCGKDAEEVHHLTPVVVGGTDAEENLISLCQHCHFVIHKRVTPISELIKLGRDHKRKLRENSPELKESLKTQKEQLEIIENRNEEIKNLRISNMGLYKENVKLYKRNTKEVKNAISARQQSIEYLHEINDLHDAVFRHAYIKITCRPRIFRTNSFIHSTLLKEWVNAKGGIEVNGTKIKI